MGLLRGFCGLSSEADAFVFDDFGCLSGVMCMCLACLCVGVFLYGLWLHCGESLFTFWFFYCGFRL